MDRTLVYGTRDTDSTSVGATNYLYKGEEKMFEDYGEIDCLLTSILFKGFMKGFYEEDAGESDKSANN